MGVMSFTINLGNWGSVFAVPAKVADEKLKLSSAYQLKVLLYVLGHNQEDLSNEKIGQALDIHEDDVKDALTYWVNEGILTFCQDKFVPSEEKLEVQSPKAEDVAEKVANVHSDNSNKENNFTDKTEVAKQPIEEVMQLVPEKKVVMSRPQKPNHSQIAQLVSRDKTLVDLLNEVQMVLGKTLSNSDTSTIVYLYDTCGLSASVIMMVVEYCISINKPNLRTIERIGVQWADEGVEDVLQAEQKITEARQSSRDFSKVASVFGIHIAGTPTAKQLAYASKWVSQWKFSDEMLREAYERCLDTKGEMKFPYIDGILKRWYNENVKNISEIENNPISKRKQTFSKSQPKAAKLDQKPSYDIEELEKRSFFDD